MGVPWMCCCAAGLDCFSTSDPECITVPQRYLHGARIIHGGKSEALAVNVGFSTLKMNTMLAMRCLWPCVDKRRKNNRKLKLS